MSLFNKNLNLNKKVVGILLITIVPTILSMLVISLISHQTIKNQIYSTSLDTLSLYSDQIDNELNSTAKNLYNIDFNENHIAMFQSDDPSENYFAANNYMRAIVPITNMLEYVEGIVVHSTKSENTIYNFANSLNSDFYDRQRVINYISKNINGKLENNQWRWHLIEGKYYLIYSRKIQETYFCAWTSINNLMEFTKGWEITEKGVIYIITDDNRIMSQSSETTIELELSADTSDYYIYENKYLVLGTESNEANIKIMEAINVQNLTWIYEMFFYITLFILIAFLFLMVLIIRNINKNIFLPMHMMQKGIESVKKGELNYQIEPFYDNIEFHNLIEAFNSMINQIEGLKIKGYEDKIEQDKISMQFLQLQIEPHFYLNALNTISAMAQVGDVDLIIELTKTLSDYMRFITKTKNGTVSIKEELEHIQNYIEIVKIRLGNEFSYIVEIEDGLESFTIPSLSIQNLVENSMKYAFDAYNNTEIIIKILKNNTDGQDGISISVEDNGNGYSEDYIRRFNSDTNNNDTRIGLRNIRKRLHYIFGNKATFKIGNKVTGGAKAVILIQYDSDLVSKEET